MNSLRKNWRAVDYHARANSLEARWQKFCALYLPRAPQDSIWRYARARSPSKRSSGWKLHVSATILNAPQVLAKVAPFLNDCGVSFKAPRSLSEVLKLNSGLDYSYSQVGKIITIYPQSDRQAVQLARRLHQLTKRFSAPSVPFDLRFADPGNVFYRFGSFEHLEVEVEGRKVFGMYGPDGKIVPDVREQARPDWVSDPFVQHQAASSRRPRSRASVRVMRVLAQRGKGGVYEAIDFSAGIPQLCLLKEGRRHGELTWDGRDGAWRVRQEERVLALLAARGVCVPRVYSSFELEGNYYLVSEYLNGETLHDLLLRRRHRLSIARVLDYGIQLATFIGQMHRAGWAWRDCKPNNIIVTADGRFVPIDFEGASPIDQPDPMRWGTPGFTPPEWKRRYPANGMTDDLFALGSMLYLLITGHVFDHDQPQTIPRLRRKVPPELRKLVQSLLHENPQERPAAQIARAQLKSILLGYSNSAVILEGVAAA